MSVYLDIKSLYPHLKVNWNVLLCKICIARRLVVDIFPWCNAHYVPFPSGTLVARRMGNGSIAFLSSKAQPEVVLFWCQMKAYIFLTVTKNFGFKFTTLWKLWQKMYLFPAYPFWFSYAFSKQPRPQCHIFIFAPGKKIITNFEVKLCKMCLTGQGQSV